MYADAQRVIGILRIDMPSVHVNVGEFSGGQRQGIAIPVRWGAGGVFSLWMRRTAALGA